MTDVEKAVGKKDTQKPLVQQPRVQQLGGAAREVAIATLACLLLGIN